MLLGQLVHVTLTHTHTPAHTHILLLGHVDAVLFGKLVHVLRCHPGVSKHADLVRDVGLCGGVSGEWGRELQGV